MYSAYSQQPGFRIVGRRSACHPVALGKRRFYLPNGEIGLTPQTPIECDNPQFETEAKDLIAQAAQYFEKLTGQAVGHRAIQIHFVNRPSTGDAIHVGGGDVEGVTFHVKTDSIIEISRKHPDRWKRILAHEVTHVFVQEAFGPVKNRTLSEGLAEYVADNFFPNQVRNDFYKASNAKFVLLVAKLQPYVDGFRFVSQHARDSRFAEFFAIESKNPATNTSRLLNNAWHNTLQVADNAGKFQPHTWSIQSIESYPA